MGSKSTKSKKSKCGFLFGECNTLTPSGLWETEWEEPEEQLEANMKACL